MPMGAPMMDPAAFGAFAAQQSQIPPPANMASLYVGELDPMVTEANLFELFNLSGPVTSIRVCRDVATRRSLGYAYVNYLNAADAEKAMADLNYTELKGRPIRIMWSQRDPAARKASTSNIFIKNLDPAIDNKALHDTFSAFGKIMSCKVVLDSNSVSKGFGYVHFESDEAAEAAIKHVNGMLLNDMPVYVGKLVSRKERMSKQDEQMASYTNVYVKNLPESIASDVEFRALVDPFGPIVSAALSMDDAGKSKGFGFVNYEQHDDAVKAVEALKDKEMDGKVIYAGRAQSKVEREELIRTETEKFREEKLGQYQGVNLYIKNLDDTVTDEVLLKEFSSFGVVNSCKVMRDERGTSRGFGFVCFSTPDEASKAVSEMNGKMLNGKPIYVALAQRKEARRQQLAAQMSQRAQMAQMPGMPGMMPGMMPGQPMFFPGAMAPRGGPMPFFQQQAMMAGGPMGGMGGMPGNGVAGPGPRGPPRFGGPGMVGPGGMMPQAGFYPNQMRGPQGGPPGGNRGGPRGGIPPNMMANRGPGRGGFKYASNARNVPPPSTGPKAPVLNSTLLASMPKEEQKRVLGETLYMLVGEIEPANTGKITGMLLEMDNSELLHLLESPEALQLKVADAANVLEQHQLQQQQEAARAAAV